MGVLLPLAYSSTPPIPGLRLHKPCRPRKALGAVGTGWAGTGSTGTRDGNVTVWPLPTEGKQGQQGH